MDKAEVLCKRNELQARLILLEKQMADQKRQISILDIDSGYDKNEQFLVTRCDELMQIELSSQIETTKFQLAIMDELERSFETILRMVCAM